MISSTTIEEIREKSDILQVVSEYVPMKKRGKNYLGLCPFHSEKTPSFTVSPDKQIFHCFGCGEGGNVFAFLMKIENIGFSEAVEMMGERVNITVKKTGGSPALQAEKDRYLDIMDLAQKFYVSNLEQARPYLLKRGISDEAAKAFGLGFAPDAWDSLYNHLFKRGVSQKDMEKLGLIIERNDKSGYYDRFRGRLMFPIFNLRNRTIGFSGRIIVSGDEAKYVNSPDSPVYNKGYNVYGINVTKDEVKKAKTAVLVEGNLDLISCWQFGVKNVVAPLGTALTSNQAKIIHRFAESVVIAFDLDSAGSSATGRSVDILKDEGLDVHVARFEGGKDPDEAIRAKGVESFQGSITGAMPWVEYKITSAISRHDLKEIESRAKAAKEAAAIIGQEKDPLVQNGYIKLVSSKLGYTIEEISSEVKRLGFYSNKKEDQSQKRVVEKPGSKIQKAEETLIKLASGSKEMMELFKSSISWQDFTGTGTRVIAEIIQSVEIDAQENHEHFVLENLPDEDSKKLYSKILMIELPDMNLKKVAEDCVNTIKVYHLKSKMDSLRGQMAQEEKEGRIENLQLLHKQFQEMNEAYRSL